MNIYRFEDKGIGMMCRTILVRAGTKDRAYELLAAEVRSGIEQAKKEYAVVNTQKDSPDEAVVLNMVIA